LFFSAAIERMLSEHQTRIADHSLRIWVMLQLEFWHREVVESPVTSEVRLLQTMEV